MSEITVTIQLGNTDAKLSRKKWLQFIERVGDCINKCIDESDDAQIHFMAHSPPGERWQNWCCVLVLNSSILSKALKIYLAEIAANYENQVAWTVGTTEFIGDK